MTPVQIGGLRRIVNGLGAAFALCSFTAVALHSQTFTVLDSFDLTDGTNPQAALVQAANGEPLRNNSIRTELRHCF